MFNFFTEQNPSNNRFIITGSDFNHIKNVLRLKVGDSIIISNNGASNLCKIESFTDNSAVAIIEQANYNDTALPISITLYQGLPKSDKMELIIQKAVELGVDEIVPVEMARSVVKLDGKKSDTKTTRWQAIAESAAKQSKRNSIPKVNSVMTFKNAMEKAKETDIFIVPYESKDGMKTTLSALKEIKTGMKIGVLIGPEGGFEEREVALAENIGGKIVSLGKRILRTETASITAISMIMLYAEMVL